MRNHNKNRSNRKLFRIILVVVIFAGSYLYEKYTNTSKFEAPNSELEHVIANQLSDAQVEGTGTVIKVLPDDSQGSQHQRFLVKLQNDHVILIAHNIDLAPRVYNLSEGNEIAFYGEFEWNDKGGVVHWTHRDPENRHAHGWLEYQGKKYD